MVDLAGDGQEKERQCFRTHIWAAHMDTSPAIKSFLRASELFSAHSVKILLHGPECFMFREFWEHSLKSFWR